MNSLLWTPSLGGVGEKGVRDDALAGFASGVRIGHFMHDKPAKRFAMGDGKVSTVDLLAFEHQIQKTPVPLALGLGGCNVLDGKGAVRTQKMRSSDSPTRESTGWEGERQ